MTTIEENFNNDEVIDSSIPMIEEVDRKGSIILYECDDSTIDENQKFSIVKSFFPDYKYDFTKTYYIGKDSEILSEKELENLEKE